MGTGVEGIVTELEAGAWCQPSRWLDSRKRRAEIYNLGPLKPNSENLKFTAYMELIAKIAIPVIAIETASKPMVQMTASTLITMIGVATLSRLEQFESKLISSCALFPWVL